MLASNEVLVTLKAITNEAKDISAPYSRDEKTGETFFTFNNIASAFNKIGTAYKIRRIRYAGCGYFEGDKIKISVGLKVVLGLDVYCKASVIILNHNEGSSRTDTTFLNNKVEIGEGKTIKIDNASYLIYKDHFFGNRFFIYDDGDVYKKLEKQFGISAQNIIKENQADSGDLNNKGIVKKNEEDKNLYDNKNPRIVNEVNVDIMWEKKNVIRTISVPCFKDETEESYFITSTDIASAFDKIGTAYVIDEIVCNEKKYFCVNSEKQRILIEKDTQNISCFPQRGVLPKKDVILLNFLDIGCHHERDTTFLNNKVEIEEWKTIKIDNVSYPIHKDHFFGDRFFIYGDDDVYEKLKKQFDISDSTQNSIKTENIHPNPFKDPSVVKAFDDNIYFKKQGTGTKEKTKNKYKIYYLVPICILFLAAYGLSCYKKFHNKINTSIN